MAELAGQLSPYGGDDQDRAALLTAVRGRFAAISLWITDERPARGDYAMIVLGDINGTGHVDAADVTDLVTEIFDGDDGTVAHISSPTFVGFPGGASVQVGEYTALPHGSITPQVIREGTIIMMDNGCSAEGYQ